MRKKDDGPSTSSDFSGKGPKSVSFLGKRDGPGGSSQKVNTSSRKTATTHKTNTSTFKN